MIFKKEGIWYPHRKDELLTAKIYIEAPEYYIVCGKTVENWQEVDVASELHLFLLPQETYDQTLHLNGETPFYFYINKKDTTYHEKSYFQEFVNSYNFYVSFFSDSLSKTSMHIIEIFNDNFSMCQSLQNVIIFGKMFYQIYLLEPQTSWIPHEIAHQWWGLKLFCMRGINFRFLEESITEYIKIQYTKEEFYDYEKLLKTYNSSIQMIEKYIPIQNISSFDSQDMGIIIYALAPLELEKINMAHSEYKLNEVLKEIFQKFKNNLINYETFFNQINVPSLKNALQDLVSKKS